MSMTTHFHPLPRRTLGLALTLAAALLLVACDGDEDDGSAIGTVTPTTTAGTEVPTASPFPTGTGAPTETAAPTETPADGAAASPTATDPESGEPTAEEAVAVLDQYFTAIGTEDYETAHGLWRGEGEASGQTYEEFVDGFGETTSISWEIGDPGRIDPGAGQRYIEIPVRITARTTAGDSQRFEGTYVLHRTADIPGATEEQIQWRIDSAEVAEVE